MAIIEVKNLTKKYGKLSGGQKQRLSIAAALVNNPKIILLDTPRGLIKNSGMVTKIIFRVLNEVPQDLLETCGGKISRTDHTVIIETAKPEKDLHRLVECVESKNIELIDLVLKQPTLEDVFLKSTGRSLRD